MPTERSSKRLGSKVGDKDGDKKHQRRLQDPLPLETRSASDAKADVDNASYASNRKASEPGERTKIPDPTTVPRSRSYFKHDDRGTAAQDGRHSGRRVTSERGRLRDTDPKDDEHATRRAAGSDVHEKEGKSLARGGDNHVWRHDRFSEVDTDAHPPSRKRRQFREEKLPEDLDPVKNAALEPSNGPNPVISNVGSERREERGRDRAYVRERSFSSRDRVEKAGFVSRDRFSDGDNGGRYRGRDKFGGRQGYRSGGSGGRVEKWKHDLFDEANRSPTPKNEDDPVAKVEALLAS